MNFIMEVIPIQTTPHITTELFFMITIIMYLVVIGVGYLTKNKYFFFAGSLLWFVPIFLIENIFIVTAATIVFILHLMIVFMSDKTDSFE